MLVHLPLVVFALDQRIEYRLHRMRFNFWAKRVPSSGIGILEEALQGQGGKTRPTECLICVFEDKFL